MQAVLYEPPRLILAAIGAGALPLMCWYMRTKKVKAFCCVPPKVPPRSHHAGQPRRIASTSQGRDMFNEWASPVVPPVAPPEPPSVVPSAPSPTTPSQSCATREMTKVRGPVNKNKKQKVTVCIAMVLIVLMLVLPPWCIKYTTSGGVVIRPCGYALLFSPPRASGRGSARIDFPRLMIQGIIVLVVAGGLLFLFKEPKEKSSE